MKQFARALPVILALCAISSAPAAGQETPGAHFGFRWDSAWTWEQLAARAARESPEAAASAAAVREQTSLPAARQLMRWLAGLPVPAEALQIPERSALDRPSQRTRTVRDTLQAALKGCSPRNNLSGMLDVAARLATARTRLKDWFLPEMQGRQFQPVAVKEPRSPAIRVHLDFRVAERLLDKLARPDVPDSEWSQIADEPAIRRLLLHRGPGRLRRAALLEYWRRAADPHPLNRLYEWVHPGSYYDYGGVAANVEAYRGLLRQLKAARPNIQEQVRARLSRYVPADLSLDARVDFLFAADADGWANGGVLGIDLEHFGDDFAYLTEIIGHECFHLAQAQAALPQTTLAWDGPDRALEQELLAPIWREGVASYIGPPWKLAAGAPPGEAAAHFAFVTATFAALHGGDLAAFKRMAAEGVNMAGPFYKAGWYMAKRIEETLGRPALVETQTLGPAAFFARYVEASRERQGRGTAMRLGPQLEAAVTRLNAGIDLAAMSEAARIGRIADREKQSVDAAKFAEKYAGRADSGLAQVIAGDFMARRGKDFELAGRLIASGLRLLGDRSGDLVRREGYLLLAAGASAQAIEVFHTGVDLDPSRADRLFMLGEGFRLAGRPSDARAAYRRALAVNAQYEPARHALSLVE